MNSIISNTIDVVPQATYNSHIVAEKILSCSPDDETGYMTYQVKWCDSWLPEEIISCMFPDLLLRFKEENKHVVKVEVEEEAEVPLGGEDGGGTTLNQETKFGVPTTAASCKLDALNLINTNTSTTSATSVAITSPPEKDSTEGLHLMRFDADLIELLKFASEQRASVANESPIQIDDIMSLRIDDIKKTVLIDTPQTTVSKKGSKSNVVIIEGRKKEVCDLCGKIVSRGKLRSHKIQIHFKTGKFKCPVCEHRCAMQSELDKHMQIHNEKYLACEYCGQKFKQRAAYGKHLLIHTVEKNWRCEVCFVTFKFQGDLKKHCFDDHVTIKEHPLPCCVCKELLKVPNSVYRHSVGHSGVKSHKCDVCGKMFKRIHTLQKHMLMHERLQKDQEFITRMGAFRCEICGKDFLRKLSLNRHKASHKSKDENNFEEYTEKKAQRDLISKEKVRNSRKVYKERWKSRQREKTQLLHEFGINPENPIAKNIDFKSLATTLNDKEAGNAIMQHIVDTEGDQAMETLVRPNINMTTNIP